MKSMWSFSMFGRWPNRPNFALLEAITLILLVIVVELAVIAVKL